MLRLLALSALIWFAVPASATEGRTAKLLYDVRWSGLSIGEVAFDLAEDPVRRGIVMRARTTGALDWFFTYRSTIESDLDRQDGSTSFDALSIFDDEADRWSFASAADGTLLRTDIPATVTEGREPVPRDLRRGPDPLALMLDALASARPGMQLEGTTYDGKRALRLEVTCAAGLEAKAPMPGLELEPSLACTVGGELLAGRHLEYGDDEDDEERSIETWLNTRLLDGLALPVLVHGDSPFGIVVVRLVGLKVQPLEDASRP